MDFPDLISFLNRFDTKQRSVVQVMSHQSMPKNHVFHKNHKVPFSNMSFSTLFKTNQNMPFSSLSLKSIKTYQIQHQASSTHTLTLYHKLPKSLSHHFNPLHPNGSNPNTLTYHILFLMPILNNTNSNKSSLYTINIVLTINMFQPTIQP